jgi:hypothetical protein
MPITRKTRGKSSRPSKKSIPVRTLARRPDPVANAKSLPLAAAVEAKPLPNGNCITRQAIAEAAYFLWQQRGGDEVVNWLEAEATLRRHVSAAC